NAIAATTGWSYEGHIYISSCTASGGGVCPAGGAEVGGYCWYTGSVFQSCTSVCTSRGLAYHNATRDYAGSAGSHANCGAVMDALFMPGTGNSTNDPDCENG